MKGVVLFFRPVFLLLLIIICYERDTKKMNSIFPSRSYTCTATRAHSHHITVAR